MKRLNLDPRLPAVDFSIDYLRRLNARLTELLRQILASIESSNEWNSFTPVFGSLTVIGATTYIGRYRIVGNSAQFQVSFKAATSIASVAGTDYLTLPFIARGLSGIASMTNDTTNTSVGMCHIDVTTSRCYLPAQVASANTFLLCGSYEI
jgi:hypothetical protein